MVNIWTHKFVSVVNCKSSWCCHIGGVAGPDAPSFRGSGDADVSRACVLAVVGIWRSRSYSPPVAKERAVEPRGLRYSNPMMVFFYNKCFTRVKSATISSNFLRRSSLSAPLVLRITCRAAMKRPVFRSDRSMTLHETRVVSWVRTGK